MISRDEFTTIANNGVWAKNTSLVQILGLCPLLAVTTNAVNGIMLSLATILVMALSNAAVASLRNLIPHEIRIPVFIPVSYTHLDVYKRQPYCRPSPSIPG